MVKARVLIILLGVFLPFLLLVGCRPSVPQGEIADLQLFPQDAFSYVAPEDADRPLLEASQRETAARRFLADHFAPWGRGLPAPPAADVFAPLEDLYRRPLFGGNLLPYSEDRKQQLAALCDRSSYPNMKLRAITVRHTDLRALPTREPGYLDPGQAGEGYPFDYFQYSAVPPNIPLHVRHRSADGAWYFVEAPHVAGWLPVVDVAPVDETFIRTFRSGKYLTVVRDGAALLDGKGNYRQSAAIGALLPLAESSAGGDWRVLIGVADRTGKGVIQEVLLASEDGAYWPMPATPATLAGLINRMMGQPYGWGGLCGNRDCSASLQDLFAAVGVSLPRNSARQLQSGRIISLEGLSPARKEELLLARGEPFMTLVGMPGHVMLFIGRYQGRAAVFHTKWGIRTRSASKGEGRHLVGRTVITSLQPGRELPDIARPEGDLRWRIDVITLLSEAPEASPNRTAP